MLIICQSNVNYVQNVPESSAFVHTKSIIDTSSVPELMAFLRQPKGGGGLTSACAVCGHPLQFDISEIVLKMVRVHAFALGAVHHN